MSKQRITRRWGVYNYDTLWDTFTTRREAREYANVQIIHPLSPSKSLEDRIRDGSISIEKVVIRREKWSGQWWSTKP